MNKPFVCNRFYFRIGFLQIYIWMYAIWSLAALCPLAPHFCRYNLACVKHHRSRRYATRIMHCQTQTHSRQHCIQTWNTIRIRAKCVNCKVKFYLLSPNEKKNHSRFDLFLFVDSGRFIGNERGLIFFKKKLRTQTALEQNFWLIIIYWYSFFGIDFSRQPMAYFWLSVACIDKMLPWLTMMHNSLWIYLVSLRIFIALRFIDDWATAKARAYCRIQKALSLHKATAHTNKIKSKKKSSVPKNWSGFAGEFVLCFPVLWRLCKLIWFPYATSIYTQRWTLLLMSFHKKS